MGTDIYVFIEHRKREKNPGAWNCLTTGGLNVPRNYLMFDLLAGVIGGAQPVVPTRGIPGITKPAKFYDSLTMDPERRTFDDRLSYEVERRLTKKIYRGPDDKFPGGEHWITLDQALDLMTKDPVPVWSLTSDGKPDLLVSPFYHNVTWLTPSELTQVIAEYSRVEKTTGKEMRLGPEWIAISNMLRTLDDGGHEARVIMFFDS
jgi:hypothetical protein